MTVGSLKNWGKFNTFAEFISHLLQQYHQCNLDLSYNIHHSLPIVFNITSHVLLTILGWCKFDEAFQIPLKPIQGS